MMTLPGTIVTLLFLVVAGILSYGWLASHSSRRRLQAELASARARQQEDEIRLTQRSKMDFVKDEFISNVSHELRTPLTSIRGALGLLSSGLTGTLDAKAHQLLRIAVTNTDRLIRLINDILDLERMTSGRASLQLQRCSLGELIQQAIETMTVMADEAQVTLAYTPSEFPALPPPLPSTTQSLADRRGRSPLESLVVLDRRVEQRRTGEDRRGVDRRASATPVPVFFDGDSDRILQVLLNLLSNAIKFSPPDSTVSINLSASADLLHLRVTDEGRGIPQEKLESIFNRFQQVEDADARQKGGTGLGLAICRSIIQQHGGAIWAQRNPGPGASLCVDLPRMSRMTDPLPGSTNPSLSLPQPPTDGVLIVCDDDSSVRTVTAEHLRRHGYDVLEVATGEQTIELADKQFVEAILLDLLMPGMTGWDTLSRLKHSPVTADIPVVILSVLSPAERPGIVNEAQGWVQKPFNENLLLAELGRVLQAADGPAQLLLVEHDDDFARSILTGFKDSKVIVHHVPSAQEAIHRFLQNPPDLLLLDLSLPEGEGPDLIEWLRRHSEFRTLPLVIYCGRDVPEEERIRLRLGPTQFVDKGTVHPREVEDLVERMVHRHRHRKPLYSDA